jgi:F420-0:gamma-glutamyl ligase-like protein
MPPHAALPPASEKGVDATAVPKTLALAGAPNAAKSVTTFRGGEPVPANLGDDVGVLVGDRGGVAGVKGYE